MSDSVDKNLKSEISADNGTISVIYSKASASIISEIPQEIRENPSGEVGIISHDSKKNSLFSDHDSSKENSTNRKYNKNVPDNTLECEIIVPPSSSSDNEEFDPIDSLSEDSRFTSKNSFYTNETFPDEALKESEEEKSSPEMPLPSPNIDTFGASDGTTIEAGYFVTLNGSKIRKVGPWDNYILGVAAEKTNESDLVPVVLWGKVVVKDDGRCMPNGFCIPNTLGIATPWNSGYRVMERKGPNEILIFLK